MPRFTDENNIKFTEGTAKSLRVPEGKRDKLWFDTEMRGFFIRKFESGKATYGIKYTCKGQPRRITLGPVLSGNLKAMRLRADEVVSAAKQGKDVFAEGKKAAAVKTLGDLLPAYLSDREQGSKDKLWKKLRPKSLEESTRYLKRAWEPFHKLAPDDVSLDRVIERMTELANTSGPIAAKRAHAALSTFFAWLIHYRHHSGTNPTAGIKLAEEEPRDRALSEAELVDVWLAAGDDDFGIIVKLLILTAQRLREIGDLAWQEIELDARQIDLPKERTNNGEAHTVPLSAPALALLQAITRHEGRQRVFVGRLGKGVMSYSWGKAGLDERIATMRGAPLEPWRLHDLRRSIVTRLVSARQRKEKRGSLELTVTEAAFAKPHVVEAIVNHKSGHKRGVAGVYNVSDYPQEKREALEQWAAHLMSLVELRLSEHQSNTRESSGEMVVGA